MIISDPVHGRMTVSVQARDGKVELDLNELKEFGGDFSGLGRFTAEETDKLILMLQSARANL